MTILNERHESDLALSQYMKELFILSNNFSNVRTIPGSDWLHTNHPNPADGLVNALVARLGELSSQTARSQRIMLASGGTAAMDVYYANMVIQRLVQREVISKQLKELRTLENCHRSLLKSICKIQAWLQAGTLPEKINQILDQEDAESIKVKSERRLERIQTLKRYFTSDQCLIGANIHNQLSALHSVSIFSEVGMHRFGVLSLPHDLDEEMSLMPELEQVVALYRKHAGRTIGLMRGSKVQCWEWDIPIAEGLQGYQAKIDCAAELIKENRDTQDMNLLVEVLTYMA